MRVAMKLTTLAALCALAACGTQPKERTTGGAAAGAATGAGIGAIAGPPGALVGAAVGAGAGAAAGATTSPNQLNLGKPPWTNPETRVPTPNGTAAPASAGRVSNSAAAQHAAVDRLNDQSLQAAQSGRSY